jgi:membrane protein implicated in regulation of membrane protease activity
MNIDFWQISLFAAILFAIVELFATSFFFLGIAFGCMATALIQWMAGGAYFYRDILIFATGSTASFLVLRFFFKKPKDITRTQDDEDINRY